MRPESLASSQPDPAMVEADQISRPVPPRALVLSLASLAAPVAWALLFPDEAGDEVGMLVWLAALIPAFLFTYYRGWEGASLALAAGMAVLTATQVFLLLGGISTPNWNLLLVVVLVYIGISFGIGLLAELLHRERREAQQMALTDPLTGLPNRRHAHIFLDAGFAAAERGSPLSVALFDIDHFKAVNDRFGHAAGDAVLRLLGEILADQTREMNLTARWGGEEFLAILSNTEGDGAVIFADRVRQLLVDASDRWGGVTLSAGIASHATGMESPELLVAAADRALYRAKEEGRDQVVVADRIPARASPAEEAGRDGTPERTPKRGASDRETILVVEDDEDTRRAVARSLEFHGYTVLNAPSGEDALALLEKRRKDGVDLLLTDIIMPGMSGFTLVHRIQARQPRIRVLYMSGYSHESVSWEGVPGSHNDFIKKPMSVEELGTRVREMLDSSMDSTTTSPSSAAGDGTGDGR